MWRYECSELLSSAGERGRATPNKNRKIGVGTSLEATKGAKTERERGAPTAR